MPPLYETELDLQRELQLAKAVAKHLDARGLRKTPQKSRWDFTVTLKDASEILLEVKVRNKHYDPYKISKAKVDIIRASGKGMLAVRTPDGAALASLAGDFAVDTIVRKDRPTQPAEPAYLIPWSNFQPVQMPDPFAPAAGSKFLVHYRNGEAECSISVPYTATEDLDKLLEICNKRFSCATS